MSADNWTKCPKCYQKKQTAAEAVRTKFYGKLPAAEYEAKLQEALKTPERESEQDTLREDYEIGIWNGEFFVDYSASCQTCGYSKTFKHKEAVP